MDRKINFIENKKEKEKEKKKYKPIQTRGQKKTD
jgi:hypothetical protein